ncbi:hypothetical protein ACR3K2_02980 [Cryptosporidium serpentis]
MELLSKAQSLLESFPPDYQEAGKLFKMAYNAEPKNSLILSNYAEYLLLVGEIDRAKEMLQKSITINPYDDYIKYFSLAQLLDGEESMDTWKKGICILDEKMKNEGDEDNINRFKSQMCSALTAIAELYMTDLCDLSDAEEQVKWCIDLALSYEKDNFETLCCQLSYFKTINDRDNSKILVQHLKDILYNKLGLKRKSVDKSIIIGDAENCLENCNDAKTPDFQFRLNLCRTLIDLDETEFAEDILDSLLEEDEEDWQVWYILAWCCIVGSNIEGAKEAVELCKKFSSKYIIDLEMISQVQEDIHNLVTNIENHENYLKDTN